MSKIISRYFIERENDDSRCYHVRVYGDFGELDFSMETSGRIEVKEGQIVSINGNGRARSDFRRAIKRFNAYRVFGKQREGEILNELEEIVCGGKIFLSSPLGGEA